MPRFFVSKEQIQDSLVQITGDDAHHIARSLRMAVGQHITICDMQGSEYACELLRFDDDKTVTARIISVAPMQVEPPMMVTLFQALPKGDKLDTIIQKGVECGVARIVPFESANCVVRVKPEAEERKQERRVRIAAEAAKQCGRGVLPSVEQTVSFDCMLHMVADADIALFCYEGEGTIPLRTYLRQTLNELHSLDRPLRISVIIGSEGGFSTEEAAAARSAGCVAIGLGPRILRTETASCFVLSALVYELEL